MPGGVTDTESGGARRYLIAAAVTRVLKGSPLLDLPELAEDIDRISGLFLGADGLGYELAGPSGLDPYRDEFVRELQDFARSPERNADDYLVLFLACHGASSPESGDHYLLMADTDPDDLSGTALRVEDLVRALWEGTRLNRVLLLLDACYSEASADAAVQQVLRSRRAGRRRTEPATTGFVIVSSTRVTEEAIPGAFTSALRRAVSSRATAGNAPKSIPLDDVMAGLHDDPEVPPTQRLRRHALVLASATPDFLPNPRYVPGMADRQVHEIDALVARFRAEQHDRRRELIDHFLPKAKGADTVTDDLWSFTGRHVALADVVSWLGAAEVGERLCVVTGGPGSGKSALLGLIHVLSQDEIRGAVPLWQLDLPEAAKPPLGAVDVAIHASHKTTRQVFDSLAAAAGIAAESMQALQAGLAARREVLTVLIDAVDEAIDPDGLVSELLRPLATGLYEVDEGGEGLAKIPLRLLIGCRPHVARRLRMANQSIDLDDKRYADPDAVREYARKLLVAQNSEPVIRQHRQVRAIAEAIADAAERSFLVAGMTARMIARQTVAPDPFDRRWRSELPRVPGEAMEQDLARLGADARRARDLLTPLAYSQGAGMPWAGFWPALATAVSGRVYRDADVSWLLHAAGSYVVESVEESGSVYRIYHRALIEYLREAHDAEHVQRQLTRALQATVEDWASAHPYVRRYLTLHAAEGGLLDELVNDAAFVLSSDPGQLLPQLFDLRNNVGQRAARAILQLSAWLRQRDAWIADGAARARLRLAAVCQGADMLAESCGGDDGHLPWRTRWAVWNRQGWSRDFSDLPLEPDEAVIVAGTGRAFLVGGKQQVAIHDLADPDRPLLSFEGYRDVPPPALVWGLAVQQGVSVRAVALGVLAWGSTLDGRRRGRLDASTPRDMRILTLWDPVSGVPQSWKLDAGPGSHHLQPVRQVIVVGDPGLAVFLDTNGRVEAGRLLPELVNTSEPRRRSARRTRDPERLGTLGYLTSRDRQLYRSVRIKVSAADGTPLVASCLAPGRDAALIGMLDGTLSVLHVDGRVITFDAGHRGPVTDACEISDETGYTLVTTGSDGSVRVLRYGPSGSLNGSVSKILITASASFISTAVGVAGRQRIVAAMTADGILHRCDLDTGRRLGPPARIGIGGTARLTVCDDDSGPVVVVQGSGRRPQMLDLVTGERLDRAAQRGELSVLGHGSLSGDKVYAGTSRGLLHVVSTERSGDMMILDAHDGKVLAIGEIIGPENRIGLISVGEDRWVTCWDPLDGHEIWKTEIPAIQPWYPPQFLCAALEVTGPTTATVVAGDISGRVWALSLDNGIPVRRNVLEFNHMITAVCVGVAAGRHVGVALTFDGEAGCWDLETGTWLGRSVAVPGSGGFDTAALAPDGSGLLVAADHHGAVHRWLLPSCRALPAPSAEHPVRSLTFCRPDSGSKLMLAALIGSRRLVSLWDPDSAISLSPPNRIVAPIIDILTVDNRGRLMCGGIDSSIVRLVQNTDGSWSGVSLTEMPTAPSAVAARLPGGHAVAVALHDELQLLSLADGALLDRRRTTGTGLLRPIAANSHEQGFGRLVTLSEQRVIEYWNTESSPVDDSSGGARLRAMRTGMVSRNSGFYSRLTTKGMETVMATRIGAVLRFQTPELDDLTEFDVDFTKHYTERKQLLDGIGDLLDKAMWLVDGGQGRSELFTDGAGEVLVVARSDRQVHARRVDLDPDHRYEVFPALFAGEPAVLATGSAGTALVTTAAIMAMPKDSDIRTRSWIARYAWWATAGGRRRRRREKLVPLHVAPPPAWFRPEHVVGRPQIAKVSPAGDAFGIMSTDSLIVLPLDRGVPATTVELGVPCVDFDFDPDGGLVIATRNGIVSLDPPRPAIGER